jgi:hypothetical protein
VDDASPYPEALDLGATVIVLLHPDYQYDSRRLWPP